MSKEDFAPSPDSSTALDINNTNENISSTALIRQNSLKNNKKGELLNLNDRFLSYIDRVRNLESENTNLHREAEKIREFSLNEKRRVRTQYETELSDLRRNIDETSREKAKLEIDSKRLEEQHDNLLQKCDKKLGALVETEAINNELEQKYYSLGKHYNETVRDIKRHIETIEQYQVEQNELSNNTDCIRNNLEVETLKRVDLENMVQSLNEEITFKESIFEQQHQQLSETHQQLELEYSDLANSLAQQYESKLQQTLEKLKLQYEEDMRKKRDEQHANYQTRLKKIQLTIEKSNNRKILEDIKVAKKQLNDLNERADDLTSSNHKLHARLNKLTNELENERKENSNIIKQMESEIFYMNEESSKQQQAYSDLLDVKISLDLELATYDKLLKVEESRLNLDPTTPTSTKNPDSEIIELDDSSESSTKPHEQSEIYNDNNLSNNSRVEVETDTDQLSLAKRKRFTTSDDKENQIDEKKKFNDNSNECNNGNRILKKKSFFKVFSNI